MTIWIIVASLALAAAGVFAGLFYQARTRMRALELEKRQSLALLTAQIFHLEQVRDTLLRATDDALLVLDTRQRILFANPAAETLFRENLIGETLTQAIPQAELKQLIQDTQSVRGEGVERHIELDKHIFQVRALVSSDGQDGIEVLTLRDITHIQRLERARREMVSNVTHELSTPITAIGLLAETLINLAEQGKTKKTRKMAKDIRREVDTLTHLVQEIRDLSLIESGQMPVRMTPTDLRAVVWSSVEPLLPLTENKAQQVQFDVPEGISVLADDRPIQRAIKNIVHNAVKFTPEGGHIRISATIEQDEAIIAVADTGPGISADDLPRVYERFYQVDRARREGTGLGLAIVRHIVMAHGGRTWVESVEGQGATFYIALALADVRQT